MQENTYCKYCHRLITFIRTVNGESMPCDSAWVDFCEDPSGEDKAILENGRIAYGYILTSEADNSVKAYRPHWASCPEADRIPRSRAGKPASSKKGVKRAATAGEARRGKEAKAAADASRQGAEAEGGNEDWEQVSLFPELRPRLQDQLRAFDA